MKVLSSVLLVVIVSCGTACADTDTGTDTAAASIKVDIAAVVQSNKVQAVDGVSSSGQPNERALQVFADSGYAAVIDLRSESENRGLDEEHVVTELGLDYISLPIAGSSAINFDNARKLDELLQQYDEPVLIHCGSGNRVGALLALRESLGGADDDAALALGSDAGLTRAEERVKEVLSGK